MTNGGIVCRIGTHLPIGRWRTIPIDMDEQIDPKATIQPEPAKPAAPALPKEIGGAKGPEPTRYGDWEHKGRCTDF